MKRLLLVMLAWLAFTSVKAQTATAALDGKSQTPQERYRLMKTNSQTFQDYKVIKERVLDAVWKITTDSLAKLDGQLAAANAKIVSLENDVARLRSELKSKEESMAEIVFASSHINIFGRDLSKKSFLVLVAASLAAFIGLVVFLLVNLKNMQQFVSESNLIVLNLTNEFDEFKKNALEKQIKLSRELQTERNKLLELKESHKV